MLRKRPRKRIAAAPRPRPQAPTGPNQVWCYDFVFDNCANGQQLKCLTVADEFTKEGLAIDVDGRIRSGRVIEVLSRLVSARGAPRFLRSDNGPEFVSKALLSWIVTQGIGTALVEPGKPWQNASRRAFNGKFRDECLSLEWFRSRAEAKVLIEEWRRHFKEFVARGTRPAPRHATGRDATVYGPPRPGPLLNRPRGDKWVNPNFFFGGPTMLTAMTEEDWTIVLRVFAASRSRRGDKGRNDRRFLEALHPQSSSVMAVSIVGPPKTDCP